MDKVKIGLALLKKLTFWVMDRRGRAVGFSSFLAHATSKLCAIRQRQERFWRNSRALDKINLNPRETEMDRWTEAKPSIQVKVDAWALSTRSKDHVLLAGTARRLLGDVEHWVRRKYSVDHLQGLLELQTWLVSATFGNRRLPEI